jgi:hypothetical protein
VVQRQHRRSSWIHERERFKTQTSTFRCGVSAILVRAGDAVFYGMRYPAERVAESGSAPQSSWWLVLESHLTLGAHLRERYDYVRNQDLGRRDVADVLVRRAWPRYRASARITDAISLRSSPS